MINRVNYNVSIISTDKPVKNETTLPDDSVDFASVYNRMQELRTAAANRSASPMAAQAAETTPSYSSVYAPGSGGVYAPRPVDLEDPKATLQKLEVLEREISEKGEDGCFDKMSNTEAYAYLFERYADAFGADFMDYGWQQSTLLRPPNESEQAKSAVLYSFYKHKNYALHYLSNIEGEEWSVRTLSQDEAYALDRSNTETFAAHFGYGDMTPEERYQAILSDYSASGDTSYAAAFKMFWMLIQTGAADADVVHNARSALHHKLGIEYASLDMTVTDMAKSRYANAYYGFDAEAEILKLVDHIHEMRERILATSPHLTDLGRYSDPDLFQFFENLAADLQVLGGLIG